LQSNPYKGVTSGRSTYLLDRIMKDDKIITTQSEKNIIQKNVVFTEKRINRKPPQTKVVY